MLENLYIFHSLNSTLYFISGLIIIIASNKIYLNVQVCREPIIWFEGLEDFHRRPRSESIRFDVVLEKGFHPKELVEVTVSVNTSRPVVTHNDIYTDEKGFFCINECIRGWGDGIAQW